MHTTASATARGELPSLAPRRLSPCMPDIGALELFLSVARFGSLGQAAVWHGISQPAAGSRIRHLESQLGLALIQRSARGSRLTEDGAHVADWAQAVVTAACELEVAVGALREGHEGRVRLAASMTVAEYLMPDWLLGLRAHCPSVAVSLQVVNSREVVRLVSAGAVEIGFVECPGMDEGLDSCIVGTDELVAVVAPHHPWARRSRPLSAAELANSPLVCREAGSGTRCTLEVLLEHVGGAAAPLLELSSTTAIKTAVRAGLGPAVLSSLAVASELAATTLVRVPVEADIDLRRDLRAVWVPDRRPRDGAAQLLHVARRRRAGLRRTGQESAVAPSSHSQSRPPP